MNKKILIPIVILVVFFIILSISIVGRNKNDVPGVVDENSYQGEEASDDNVEIHKDTLETNKDSIIVFGKNNGKIKLYDSSGALLDSIELIKQSNNKENNGDNEIQYAFLSTVDGMIKTQIKENKIFLYDEDGNIVNSISLDTVPEEETNEKEEEKADITEASFTTFRTVENELLFRDDIRNTLSKVDAVNGKIEVTLIVDNMNLENLNNTYITNESIYLTFDNDVNIYQMTKKSALSLENEKNIEKYELNEAPNFAIPREEYIYFATPTTVGKYDIKEENIEEIKTEDVTSDMYIDDEFLYVVNNFGEGKDNSVLMKISIDDMQVMGIMELKGLKSKIIGTNNETMYIRQKNGIKEVNLKDFKPKTSRNRQEGVPVQVVKNKLYSLENGAMKIVNIESNKAINSFNVEGFTFHVIPEK